MNAKIKDRLKKYIKPVSYLCTMGIKADTDKFFCDHTVVNQLINRYEALMRIKPLNLKLFLYYFCGEIKKGASEEKREKIIKQFKELIHRSDSRQAAVLINVVFFSEIFDKKVSEIIIDFAKVTEDRNLRYWITQNISKFCFFSQNGMYDGYFRERKQLVRQCAEDMELTVPEKTRRDGSKRLCIVTYLQDPDPLNSAQRVSCMIANGLERYYDEIKVVVLDCFIEGNDDFHEWCSVFKYRSGIKQIEKIRSMYNRKVDVEFCIGRNYRDRFQHGLNIIYSFDPDCIIDLSDEYSIISYYYSKDYFTLSVPMRVGASSLYFNAIEGVGWRIEAQNEQYHFLGDEEVIEWSFPESVLKEEISLNRESYDLPENAFVMLTLGKCAYFCSNEFIDELCRYLNDNPDSVWLIIGDTIPDYLLNRYGSLVKEKRVRSRSYEKKIGSLCSICDILLRVDTTGGSGATAIAAMYGLPVVMTDFPCDSMRWLGRDFSDIHDYSELFKYVHDLQTDEKLYTEKQSESKKLVMKAVDSETKWKELYNSIERITSSL